MIKSKIPFRISFFGGGTDYPDWYKKRGGAVVSTTIDKYINIYARELPPFFDFKYKISYSNVEKVKNVELIKHKAIREILKYKKFFKNLEINLISDLPARSGLGSSSAFTVGFLSVINYLQNKSKYSKYQLAMEAIKTERKILKENVGCQDQIAVSYGGFNKINFYQNDTFKVSKLNIPEKILNKLNNNLMLFFTGFPRIASNIAKKQIENIKQDKITLNITERNLNHFIEILRQNKNFDDIGILLHEAWHEKKKISDLITNYEIDKIYNFARKNGALGGKILGAGGGGFMLLYVNKIKQNHLKKKLKNLIHVPFKFENSGCTIKS